MDRNFHIDDFERLLREKSDEFRMYPSKRIWHSIYNNIHPGRKWPSVAMTITLITTLLLVGYLNTKNTSLYTNPGGNVPAQMVAHAKFPQFVSQPLIDNTVGPGQAPGAVANNENPGLRKNNTLNNYPGNVRKEEASKSSITRLLAIIPQQPVPGYTGAENGQADTHDAAKKETAKPVITEIDLFPPQRTGQTETPAGIKTEPGNNEPGILTYAQKTGNPDFIQNIHVIDFANIHLNKQAAVTISGGNSAVERNNLAVNKNDVISISGDDKTWIENYALYHRPATRKWANKLSWQKYVTPSVVYRKLYTDPNFGSPLNAPPLAISSSQDINRAVIHKPSAGLEIGTGLTYSITKIIKLKAGLQFNYTRYNSEAFQNTHPFTTRITMHDYAANIAYEEIRTTPYSNKSGLEAVNLHNETYQISLPVGADFKLIGNENLQWNFGVTIQPSFVPGGKSYLISTDRRNYVKEISMINRWNLNAGFETFVSFKASNGLTYQLGPQFRTQLFSTNSKRVAVEEKLLNYGLKFGISKTLK